MKLESIEVGNFRNYENAKLEFHPKTNILYGDNAQGKTNILESIYVCATTNSHKGSKDKELIRFGEDEAHIRMFLTKREMTHKIDMHLRKSKGKGIAIDGVPIKRSSELMGLAHVIFFSPEDLKIIKNGPSERRRFVNMELCQLDPLYLYELAEYNKVLMQRNKLLKQISFSPSLESTLSIWDEKLIEYGEKIIVRRQQFVNVALVAVIKQGAPAADGIGNAVVLNDAQNAWHKQNARDAEAKHGFEREQEEIFDRDAPAAGEQTHKEVDDRECHHADEEIIIHDARGGDHERKNAAALCVHVFIERG